MNIKKVNVFICINEETECFTCTITCGNTSTVINQKTEKRYRYRHENKVWWACNVTIECIINSLTKAWDCVKKEMNLTDTDISQEDILPLNITIETPYGEGTRRTIEEDGFFKGRLRNAKIRLDSLVIQKNLASKFNLLPLNNTNENKEATGATA